MNLTTGKLPIWLASGPVDFRKSIDGLCQIVKEQFHISPHDGIFIFYNSSYNRVKILMWHVNGFMLLYKRYETGKLIIKRTKKETIEISHEQLNWMLLGVDWMTLSGQAHLRFEDFN